MKRQGVLIISVQTGRMDIRFGLDDFYGGLHCGTHLEVLIDGNWIPTRIEMADDWFGMSQKGDSFCADGILPS